MWEKNIGKQCVICTVQTVPRRTHKGHLCSIVHTEQLIGLVPNIAHNVINSNVCRSFLTLQTQGMWTQQLPTHLGMLLHEHGEILLIKCFWAYKILRNRKLKYWYLLLPDIPCFGWNYHVKISFLSEYYYMV